jgi:hypothetical protein
MKQAINYHDVSARLTQENIDWIYPNTGTFTIYGIDTIISYYPKKGKVMRNNNPESKTNLSIDEAITYIKELLGIV